jgi:hypothetical protein
LLFAIALAVGIALMLLGHTSDEEKAGRRLFWSAGE